MNRPPISPSSAPKGVAASYDETAGAEPQRAGAEPQRAGAEPQRAGAEPQHAGASAGRGGLALTGGKIFFLVAGLVQQIVLKAILGLSGYGALSTTLSIASIAYNPMVQSGIQGVSRETASLKPDVRPVVFRRLLRLHFLVALILATAFFLLAPLLARAIGAPHIEGGVRALSIVLLLYGLYAPLVGYLNGQRHFLGQAGLDAFAAFLRTLGLLGGAYLSMRMDGSGSGAVLGTCLGFAIAAAIVLLVASRFTGLGRSGETPADLVRRYMRTLRHMWAGQILLNLLFQADALLLRRFASDAAGLAQLPSDAADPFVGAYRATQLFCFLPVQLLTSVTFVLFPLLAQAKADGRPKQVARLVGRGLRLSVLLTGLLVCVLVARPEGLLAVVFGVETAELGASTMRILALGMGTFAVLGVLTAALNSLGFERVSTGLFLGATLLVGSACFLLAYGEPLEKSMLERTAMGTSTAMLITTLVASLVAQKLMGAAIGLLTSVRVLFALLLSAALVSQFFPKGLVYTLLSAPVAMLSYLGLLVLQRELNKDDARAVLALLRR